MTSPRIKWSPLGLNLLEEPIEEAPGGRRRVLTSSGPKIEPDGVRDIRFGRLSSSEQGKMLANALAWPRVLGSYSNSISRVAAVWMTPPGHPTRPAPPEQVKGLSQAVSLACAQRCWEAWRSGLALTSLPDWSAAMSRPGAFPWPLGIDMGVAHRLGLNMDFDQFTIWARAQQRAGRYSVKLASGRPDSSRCIVQSSSQSWEIRLADHEIGGRCSVQEFAPPIPPLAQALPGNDYLPFSSDDPQPSGHVDTLLSQAQQRARPGLDPKDVRSLIAKAMEMDVSVLSSVLSDEQLDAVWLAWRSFEEGRSFLLADETGYGKGRVLAALARIAHKTDRQVMFVTERKALLSDFWRDASVLFEQQVPHPTVSHGTARLLSPDGSTLSPQPPRRLPQVGDKWVWTTYSQFNRKNPTRLSAFQSWVKSSPTWLLLDEAHNAASESATAMHLDMFQKAASGVMYSSATFAKTEAQLQGYRRLFEGSRDEWFRMMSAFDVDSDTLRTALTLAWAQRGSYLRREHPPMPLPDPVWLEVSEQRHHSWSSFAYGWRTIYDLALSFSAQYPEGPPPWLVLGAPLSRALREYAILDKAQDVVFHIKRIIQEDKKPVVVSDWTLSSHVSRALEEHEDMSSSEEHEDVSVPKVGKRILGALWRDSWKRFIRETFTDDDIASARNPDLLETARKKALAALDLWPDWSISPFDTVVSELKRAKINIGEVSGRSWTMERQEDDSYLVIPRADDRQTQVARFNSGQVDALLLTRAGNSGISLHAGRQFSDQRQRVLIEWDVAPDPSVRIQFWGRVRRRDQVSEPERFTLLLDTPSERRKFHREAQKQRRLVAHGGSAAETGTAWSGPAADYLAGLWCEDQPTAFLMGRNPTSTQVFSRSIVLPDSVQTQLITQLDRGLSLMSGWMEAKRMSWSGESRIVRKHWWWGQGDSSCFWQERVFTPRPAPGSSLVQEVLAKPGNLTAALVAQKWGQATEVWITRPKQATASRKKWFSFWQKNHASFERGMAIEAKDPATGERVRGVVVDFDIPEKHWDASQIGMSIWLSTQPKPLTLPLPAWFDPNWGGLRPLGVAASPSWFDVPSWPVAARILVGPPGVVAAWGVRQHVRGELVRLDGGNSPVWGWRMPSTWSWGNVLTADRELANTAHAQLYLRQNPHHPLIWRWSSVEAIQMLPQSGGLLITGNEAAWQRLSFPVRRQMSRPDWSAGEFRCRLSWKSVRPVFESLVASGALPVVPADRAQWCLMSWPNQDRKKTIKK